MKRNISSNSTALNKIVAPLLLPPFFLFLLMLLLREPRMSHLQWPFIIGFLVFYSFTLWSGLRLKKVSMDDGLFYVSNYLKEIQIPFSSVAEIKESKWGKYKRVVVVLNSPSGFGQKIVFAPASRFLTRGASSPSIVNELKQRAGVL